MNFRVAGYICSIIGVLYGLFLLFIFRSDSGSMQNISVLLMLILPMILSFVFIYIRSTLGLLLSTLWSLPVIVYTSFYYNSIFEYSELLLIIPLLLFVNVLIFLRKRNEGK